MMRLESDVKAEMKKRIADYDKLRKKVSTSMLEGVELAEAHFEKQTYQDLSTEIASLYHFIFGEVP